MKWSYGVTTTIERKETTLPRTLASLAAGGFPTPRLFVDACNCPSEYAEFGLEVSCRYPRIRTMGNWWLGLVELYTREPAADFYAMFQDDLVTYVNLRQYLESCSYPTRGYLNLYTVPNNENIPSRPKVDGPVWYPSNQCGVGALALVFDREAVISLLKSAHWINRPQDLVRGWRAIDGGIVTALQYAGWKEYVHYPSLVQHTGEQSTCESPQCGAPHFEGVGPIAIKGLAAMPRSFKGEDFDASTMINTAIIPPVDVAWETEYNALTQAIAGDEERLRGAANNPAERGRYERLLFNYRANLAKHMRSKPG